MAEERVHRLVTFGLQRHLVARTFQNVLSAQVLPPQVIKGLVNFVAGVSTDFNDESSM